MEVSIAWLIAALVIGYVAGTEIGYHKGQRGGWHAGRLDAYLEWRHEQRGENTTEWWQRGDPPPWEEE